MEEMPTMIISVTVAMIVLAVGVFAFFITTSEIGFTKEQVQSFNVTNPSVANTFTLRYFPESVKTVEQYNGIAWVAVSSTYWELTRNQVVVQPGGMQG